MNKNNIRLIIFLLNLLLASSSLQSALPAGTLVKTAQSHVPIEFLGTNDKIISCDLEADNHQNFFSESSILATQSFENEDPLIVIKTAQAILKASSDHLFFDASTLEWKAACKLTNNSKLITSSAEIIDCLEITFEQFDCRLHKITLQEPHIFFISEHEILVHNEPITAVTVVGALPLLPPPIAVPIIGGCAVVGIGIATGELIKKLIRNHRNRHHDTPQQPENDSEVLSQETRSPTPAPEQPENSDNDEKKKKDEKPSNDEDKAKDDKTKEIKTTNTKRIPQEEIEKIKNPKSDKYQHIFGEKERIKHRLEKLSGTDEEIADKIIEITQRSIDQGKIPEHGPFKIYEKIDGHQIEIRGAVVEEEIRFGTFFVDEACC